MKTVTVERSDLSDCVHEAQKDRLLITQRGKPVALLIGVEGMDEEQIELGASEDFWTLIRERRCQDTFSRKELDAEIAEKEKALSGTKTRNKKNAPKKGASNDRP